MRYRDQITQQLDFLTNKIGNLVDVYKNHKPISNEALTALIMSIQSTHERIVELINLQPND